MTEQFFGQCEYCEEWLHGLRIHDTEQFGELELCKGCRDLADNGELEACGCGAKVGEIATTTTVSSWTTMTKTTTITSRKGWSQQGAAKSMSLSKLC